MHSQRSGYQKTNQNLQSMGQYLGITYNMRLRVKYSKEDVVST